MARSGKEQGEKAGAAADVEHVERPCARQIGNQPAPGVRLRIGEQTVARLQIEVAGAPVPMLAHQLLHSITVSMTIRRHAIHIGRRRQKKKAAATFADAPIAPGEHIAW